MASPTVPRSSLWPVGYGSDANEEDEGSEDSELPITRPCRRSNIRFKRRRLLHGMNPGNIIEIDGDEDHCSESGATSRQATSSVTHRRVTRESLNGPAIALYDLKYHPMDDVVNKRRARAHRKRSDYAQAMPSDESLNDGQEFVGDGEDDESDTAPTRPQRKGSRASSRNFGKPKPLYNMQTHPADKVLKKDRREQEREIVKEEGRCSSSKSGGGVEQTSDTITGVQETLNSSPPHITIPILESSNGDSPSSSFSHESDAKEKDDNHNKVSKDSPANTGITELEEPHGMHFDDAMASHQDDHGSVESERTSEQDERLLEELLSEGYVTTAPDFEPDVQDSPLARSMKRKRTKQIKVYEDQHVASEIAKSGLKVVKTQLMLDDPKENRHPTVRIPRSTAPVARMQPSAISFEPLLDTLTQQAR